MNKRKLSKLLVIIGICVSVLATLLLFRFELFTRVVAILLIHCGCFSVGFGIILKNKLSKNQQVVIILLAIAGALFAWGNILGICGFIELFAFESSTWLRASVIAIISAYMLVITAVIFRKHEPKCLQHETELINNSADSDTNS